MGKLIWLASYPKSGNTWLRAFLNNYMRPGARPHDINRLTDLSVSEAAVKWFARFDPRPWTDWSDAEVMALRPRVHRLLTTLYPHDTFVKTHNALVSHRDVPLVTQALTAGAVYVLRNPLDVVLSFADHHGITIDEAIDIMADTFLKPTTERNVLECHGSWSLNVESWTRRAHPGLHVLRYEDMLDAPARSFGGLVRFLGLPHDRARLDRAIKASSFKVLRAQEAAHGFKERSDHSERFFRVGRAGQWRSALSQAQAARIVERHRDQMARFDYLPPGG